MTSTDEQSNQSNQLVPVIFIKTYNVGAFPRYTYLCLSVRSRHYLPAPLADNFARNESIAT